MEEPQTSVDLALCPDAESEWTEVVRPWLAGSKGQLRRSLLIVPTRGQAHALKRRCLAEGIALFGVEFLTPALARRKCLAHMGRQGESLPSVIDRGLLLLGLRSKIAQRLAGMEPADPAQTKWKSLESDLDRAVDDFEELLDAGFLPGDFPLETLASVFSELVQWVDQLGYALGPLFWAKAGLKPAADGGVPLADRILLLAAGPESRPEFFSLAAILRRSPEVAAVLRYPRFEARESLEEAWVEMWQALLGRQARTLGSEQPPCGSGPVALLVGRNLHDEMDLVAARILDLLGDGASNIAIIFPGPGPAHQELVRLLTSSGIEYDDLVASTGWASVEIQIQRTLVDFYERGCRLEELLELWPLLRSVGLVSPSPGEARAECEWMFSSSQSHGVEILLPGLERSGRPVALELARVAGWLLPPWPKALLPAEALGRFDTLRERLRLSVPAGWGALRAFASRCQEEVPGPAMLEALRQFLPARAPVPAARTSFAPVTLTTLRRAAGTVWSDVIFTGCNRGVWPQRMEPSCWLSDEDRRRLNERGRFGVGLMRSEDSAALSRRLCELVVSGTRGKVFLSAALLGPDEGRLSPNAWFERVMWGSGGTSGTGGPERDFERLAVSGARPGPAPEHAWADVWSRRRNPTLPFDEFFFCDPLGPPPDHLSAKLIEEGLLDPVRLWFGAVLDVRRSGWDPFRRARKRLLGQEAHRMLALCLKGDPVDGPFMAFPERELALRSLGEALALLRRTRPDDRYWDSYHAELEFTTRSLLEQVLGRFASPYVAVELPLPEGARIPIGDLDTLRVRGRIDLVLSDLPRWRGANFTIIDFKTGSDPAMSAERMGRSASSLQLGLYLAAAQSLGASGVVWMLKTDEEPSSLGMDELPSALAALKALSRHLSTGKYGALTADRTEFTHGFEWPVACAPIPGEVLGSKYAATFGEPPFFSRKEP